MKPLLAAATAGLIVAIAAPAAAQRCGTLSRLDNFGSVSFGSHHAAVPAGLSVVEQCENGVATGVCVLRDQDGVTYTLYEGYVISKFVFVGDGALPWGFDDEDDRARAANLLTRNTDARSSGVLDAENQLHVRSRFGCGEGVFGQAFARYSGNRLVAVGLEADL